MKDSFVFHKDWYLALKGLDVQDKVEVYEAIMSKIFDGVDKKLSPVAQMAMNFISPQIERDVERYNSICEQRKLFGSKGGIAKATKRYQKVAKGSKSKQKVASVADNDNNISSSTNVESDNDIIDIEVKDKSFPSKKKNKLFIPPTLNEVEAYVKEKGYHFSAKAFFDYYEADDWHYGKGSNRTKISNWKRCCATWEERRTTSNNIPREPASLFDNHTPEPEDEQTLLQKAYEELNDTQEAEIYGMVPYEFHMLNENGKKYWREVYKDKMLDWIKNNK